MLLTDESDHIHNWWLYYLCEDNQGVHKIFEDPHYPAPTYFARGYECYCGEQKPLSNP